MSGRLPVIGLDVDDVVADLLTPWLNRYNRENGTTWTPADMTQWSMSANLNCKGDAIYKHLTDDIYDEEVQPHDGALEAVNAIKALGYRVAFVTNCLKGGEVLPRKIAWLKRHKFVVGGDSEVYGTGDWSTFKSKNDVPVDWLVDDHIGNLTTFTRGYPILLTRPHNRNLIWNGKRIKHLRDLVPMLKVKVVSPSEPVDVQAVLDGDTVFVEKPAAVRRFETGATRDVDTNKLDYEAFFSPAVLKRRAEYMHKNRFQKDGSMRAGDNWQKGIPVDAYMKSLMRHVMSVWTAYRTGQPLPEDEMCAISFNTEGLLYETLVAKGEAKRPGA